jgi:RNA-directed DNA polymerase
VTKAKPYQISKRVVWDAYKEVRRNRGAAGVDQQSLDDFGEDLKGNLYKIWNRMSSGSYFPPPVLSVAIPKKDGGERILGVPTVSDRIAQAVARQALEPLVEPCFHPDSYGYRPGRSAHDALDTAKRRCWKRFWVVDLDVKGFFDNIDHDLLMRAVRHHQPPAWVVLYIERWLKAPSLKEDGTLVERTKGTPQGGVISPLLANLFLHYALDDWLRRKYPDIQFERYADDAILHCRSRRQAEHMLAVVRHRLQECNLELHPTKTKIVFCRQKRMKEPEHRYCFDFLGCTFRGQIDAGHNEVLETPNAMVATISRGDCSVC